MQRGREVLLGVGGGIAAYKACDVLRRLQDHGFDVTVVPTPSSLNFVGSATWEALSGKPVSTQVWERVDQVKHISLAAHAKAILIAPATADLIARITQGRADDLLTNTVLASEAPIMIVPAMHPNMWLDDATQSNVRKLRERGYTVMEPSSGRLTGKDSGVGRFPATEEILTHFFTMIGEKQDFLGKKVLVSAGGTREPIDPVRYIGNRSSGKQGIAIARRARDRGAQVTLILANASSENLDRIEVIGVETAHQMQDELRKRFSDTDLLVMAAAVADARPKFFSLSKIKKTLLSSIELEQNPDILASLTSSKKSQVVIAFAAETSQDITIASEKMQTKGADIIYLNDVSGGAIFGSDRTQGILLLDDGAKVDVPPMSKEDLGELLLDHAIEKMGR